MGLVEMVMPKMGESVMEGTILGWLKNVGDKIEQDESVLEVATDKVDTEVPAPYNGVLKEILAQEGDVIQVGSPIAILETEDVNATEATPAAPVNAQETQVATNGTHAVMTAEPVTTTHTQPQVASNRFYSPLVLNIAREEKISMQELETVPGTGKEGRVTKNDILGYISNRGNQKVAQTTQEVVSKAVPQQQTVAVSQNGNGAAEVVNTPPVQVGGNDEIIEMDRMRKMIAQRMVDSKRISPHVTSFVEADLTSVVKWRNQEKGAFKEREKSALTFTPIFIEAIAKAMKDYPMMNISVDGDKIIKKKDINIGMAVALPSGNLIVPVIKNADYYNLSGLALKVNDLARRARENKLKPDELSGGTYTMSNVGTFGNVLGTPIIMQPQVGIMAFGAIRKKPAVIETPDGDMIGIRHQMFLSHSYDHRVVDGALGGMFVRRVADYLEKFDTTRKI